MNDVLQSIWIIELVLVNFGWNSHIQMNQFRYEMGIDSHFISWYITILSFCFIYWLSNLNAFISKPQLKL